MSKTVDNIDMIIAIRDLCHDIAKDAKIEIDVYPLSFPDSNRPDEFLVIKDFPIRDKGNAASYGSVEVCIYAHNLRKEKDSSTPNLERLKELTDIFLPKLNDGIKHSTAITSTTSRIVRHKEIHSFYQSIICETINITNKTKL